MLRNMHLGVTQKVLTDRRYIKNDTSDPSARVQLQFSSGIIVKHDKMTD